MLPEVSKKLNKVVHDMYEIYNQPYPNSHSPKRFKEHTIARPIHGIQHAVRAAIYSDVFISLYRRYKDEEALLLTDEDIELLKISLLFHDAARESDGIDEWDKESALMLYHYLVISQGVKPEKALIFAEAVANKDSVPGNIYHKLVTNTGGQLTWRYEAPAKAKSIYQKIIHDADCLDIIRVRTNFNATYLDFYQQIASKNDQALVEMGKLITEARSLIYWHGDDVKKWDNDIKSRFDNPSCYEKTRALILEYDYHLLQALSDPKTVIDASVPLPIHAVIKEEELTEAYLEYARKNGIVLARGIENPSESSRKHNESLAHLELYKTNRRKGIPSRTQKEDRFEKDGNPNRSVSLAGHGTTLFPGAGFLIVDADIDAIKAISARNMLSGKGKKKQLLLPELTKEQKIEQIKQLKITLMKGGLVSLHGNTYSEIIYHIKSFDAIYYTVVDSTLFECPHKSILNAVYLQQEYERMHKKTLPIFEYASIHDAFHKKEIAFSELLTLWEDVYRDYLEKYPAYSGLETEAVINNFKEANSLAFDNYPEDEQRAITDKIKELIERMKAEKTSNNYPEDEQSTILSQTNEIIGRLEANDTLNVFLKEFSFFKSTKDIDNLSSFEISSKAFF